MKGQERETGGETIGTFLASDAVRIRWKNGTIPFDLLPDDERTLLEEASLPWKLCFSNLAKTSSLEDNRWSQIEFERRNVFQESMYFFGSRITSSFETTLKVSVLQL